MGNRKVNENNESVGEGDIPGKCLYNTGASNHYSPFRHLFMRLVKIVPPVELRMEPDTSMRIPMGY